MSTADKQIWTIGHSTHSLEDFIAMLQSFNIQLLADVRSFPGSRRYPHFNKSNLQQSLPNTGISYTHIPKLGGRRKANPNSLNTGWRNESFRGYADYMETELFKQGIEELEALAQDKKVAYMCSEAVWWRCHRSMISDYLKSVGWKVTHIMALNKSQEHKYTEPAKIIEGKLTYQEDGILPNLL